MEDLKTAPEQQELTGQPTKKTGENQTEQTDPKKITSGKQENAESNEKNPDLVTMIDEPTWKVILFDLVKKNNFNPWDINIVSLADAYMNKIQSLKKFDFHIPANAVLCASILLRIKSDIFKIDFKEEPSEDPDASMFSMFDDSFSMDETLLNDLTENTSVVPHLHAPKRITKRKVTLTELVDAINDVLHRTRQPRKQPVNLEDELDFMDYFNAEETETIEENVKNIYETVKKNVDNEGLTNFSTIIESNEPEEKVSKFFPLLYLMNDNKINLWQDDFFGEIFIALIENQKA
ncbi:MAG: segregation/condensation protein A [Candidatus Diapherotrites archaeon]|nr:segregation/condensation protein A [Candidatus Diapherotrites archaeon]